MSFEILFSFYFDSLLLTSANFLLICNLCVQITAISIIHDDAQAALVHKRLFVCDDVGVTHRFEYMNLSFKEGRRGSEELKFEIEVQN